MTDPFIFPGLPDSSQILARLNRKEDKPDVIIDRTCEVLGLDRKDLLSKSRKRELSEGRTIVVGLILQVDPKMTLKRLGKLLGGRDHSTVIYMRTLFAELYETDRPFTMKVRAVLKEI